VKKFKIEDILKWTATSILIVGSAVNGLGYYPMGPIILAIGGSIWFAVSLMWREWSLVLTNGVMTAVGVAGLLIRYFG
jgi:hypothetical protein